MSEITRLRVSDVVIDAEIPYIRLCEDAELGRTLKTKPSTRDVPLVGLALWAAQRALCQSGGHNGWLFRFGGLERCTSRSYVNEWLWKFTSGEKTSHHFRHTMVTRLREAEVQDSLIEQIVGHAGTLSKTTAGYDHGRELGKLRDALLKVALPMEG